jgi:hypothetical protein
MLEFEWNKAKSGANLRKHGVSFEEACTSFYDDLAVEFFDAEHSADEDRFLLLGISSAARLLLVCHCEQHSNVVRIISARKATTKESAYYLR